MKKILLFAAALAAFVGCTEKEVQPQTPPEPADSIELSVVEKTFDDKGGKTQLVITSTGEWTAKPTAEYDWARLSSISGVDGDQVTLTVDANTSREQKKAEFVFTCGKAEQTLNVFSNPSDIPSIELKSEQSNVFGYEAVNKFEIKVFAEGVYYQDFKAVVSEDAKAWLKYVATLPGDTDNDATIIFEVAALEGLDDRQAVITISAEGTLAPVEVTVLQEAKHVLEVAPFITAAMEGETIEVPVTANVEYKIDVTSEAGADWVKYKETRDGNLYFEVSALDKGKRTATVTLTQTDAKEGEEALVASFSVTQQEVLIHWAAEMTKNRLFPKWEGGGPGACSAFTWEFMFRPSDFNKAAGSVLSLMGIEGEFLLRLGDVGNDLDHLQIATARGNYNVPFKFEAETWYHLAVTFENYNVIVYVDGKKVGETKFEWLNFNMSPVWGYEENGRRCLWIGYSYNSDRDFRGQMTEIRIWKKALTAEEINAEGHFYSVDPKSEGLFSYWKFTKGEGEIIEDATGKGNPLYGEINVKKERAGYSEIHKGDPGIKYAPVSLPEK